MAAGDARPVPRKAVAHREYFHFLDADGDPVAPASINSGIGGAAGDNKVSVQKDGGAGANSSSNVGSSGLLFWIDLSAGEMTADHVCIIARCTDTGVKSTVIHIYPEEAGDYRVDSANSSVGSVSGNVGGNVGGNVVGSVGSVLGSVGGSVATVIGDVTLFNDGITSAKLAASAVTEIADAVWQVASRQLTSGTNIVLTKGVGLLGLNDISFSLVVDAMAVALDTAIPAIPTTNSIFERVKTLDDNYTAARAPNLDNLDTTISSRASPAQVDTELRDVLATELLGDPSQAAPSLTPSVKEALALLYFYLRNEVTNDGTTLKVKNDAGTVVWKRPVSEIAGLFTRGKAITGP